MNMRDNGNLTILSKEMLTQNKLLTGYLKLHWFAVF